MINLKKKEIFIFSAQILIFLMITTRSLSGSGIYGEQGVGSTGRGGTGVAFPFDVSDQILNPSGLAHIDGLEIEGGYHLLYPDIDIGEFSSGSFSIGYATNWINF